MSANDQIIEEGDGRESSDGEGINQRTPTKLNDKRHRFGSAEQELGHAGITDAKSKGGEPPNIGLSPLAQLSKSPGKSDNEFFAKKKGSALNVPQSNMNDSEFKSFKFEEQADATSKVPSQAHSMFTVGEKQQSVADAKKEHLSFGDIEDG